MKRIIIIAKKNDSTFNFIKLYISTIRLSVFTDAGFASNWDHSSQLGYIISLVDAHQNSNLLHCRSFKSRQIARIVLAAGCFALNHAFDVSSTLRITLKALFGTEVPFKFYTDSCSLFDNIVAINAPTERRLFIDLSILRQSYEHRETF